MTPEEAKKLGVFAEVYPTHVRRVFIWVFIYLMAGSILDWDGWLVVASMLLVGDGLTAWLERRRG